MRPVPPQWFKLRQGKVEATSHEICRLTAPNQQEAFISIRKSENGRWSAALRLSADGPDVASTEPEFATPVEAWEAAFELYRSHVIF